MKTAVRVLVIIAAVIGFVWGIVGFFGGAFAGAIAELAEEEAMKKESLDVGVNAFAAFFVVIAGLVFGIVCAREKSKKATTIVNGLLLLLCGIIATALQSWIAGPMYVLSGFLGFIAGLMIKKTPEQEAAGS